MLRELIWKMAGIEPLPNLSDAQISAMAGGPTLRIEAVASSTRGARLDPSEVTLRGPQRLGKTLLDSSLALPLLIQVAQQRQSCVFTAQDTHLKSLASLYDAVGPTRSSDRESHGRDLICGIAHPLTDPRCLTPIPGTSNFSRCDLGRGLQQQDPSLPCRSRRALWDLGANLYADHPTEAQRSSPCSPFFFHLPLVSTF